MTIHNAELHGDYLLDGCPRCDEHAEHPLWRLSRENVTKLLARIERREPHRSLNEGKAMARIQDAIVLAERLWTAGWRPLRADPLDIPYDSLVGFAEVLAAAGILASAYETISYFKKPSKWQLK